MLWGSTNAGQALAAPSTRTTTPRMVLLGDRGARVEVPFAPVPTEHGGYAVQWLFSDREGRRPLDLPGAPGLRVWSASLVIARLDYLEHVEDILADLVALADSHQRVTVSYGPLEAGAWRITGCNVRVVARQPVTNYATRAEVQLQLTQAGEPVNVGPLSGGVGPPTLEYHYTSGPAQDPTTGVVTLPLIPGDPPTETTGALPGGQADGRPIDYATGRLNVPPAPPPAPPARRIPATTRVYRDGDRVYSIALEHYGDGKWWREILAASGVRDVRRLVPGQVLTLPAAG